MFIIPKEFNSRMNIKSYIRLLKDEFDYLGITNKQRKVFVENLLKEFQVQIQKGVSEEQFISDLGPPKDYAKKLDIKRPAITRGYWTVIGLSLGVVLGATFNDITLTIIFAGAFILIDLTSKTI